MQTKTRSDSVRLILLLSFVILFVLFMYTFLHEAGHAIVGFALGQSVTEFNINFLDLSAHVNMAGGQLSQSQLAVQAMAGVTLPLLVWVIFISLVPRTASFTLESIKLVSSLAVLNTLLAWILIPIFDLFGNAPSSDDVTQVLRFSQIPSLLLSCIALMMYIAGWIYFLSRINGLRNEFLMFQTFDHERLVTGDKSVSWMIAVAAVCLVLVFTLNHPDVKNPQTKLAPPVGFEVIAEVKLSRQTYSNETLAEFTLEEPADIGVFIVVRDIDTSYFDLSLSGPDGYRSTILHGENYRADRDGGLWEERLLPGTYQVVLTSNQSPGTAAIFLKTR
jgi:hypothetical protein